MAFKNCAALSSRNRSALVTQLHKLINYYGAIFSPRDRNYINELTKYPDCIYWLEGKDQKLSAAAIIDPKYTIETSIPIKLLGHMVSTSPGQMDRILYHVLSDFEEHTVAIMCSESMAECLDKEKYDLHKITPFMLMKYWKELGESKTDYFNVASERLVDGMERKKNNLYIKFAQGDFEKLPQVLPGLFAALQVQQVA
jgi:hypothetical protein